jgi:hypothetical protein
VPWLPPSSGATLPLSLNLGCRFGKRDGMKSIRACAAYIDIDVATLIWTPGHDFPIGRLETRMKCPRCGSRRGLFAFEPRENEARQRVRGVHLVVPEMGFGGRLHVMRSWCRQKTVDYMTRGAGGRGEPDAMRWCFVDPGRADDFQAEFGGVRMRLGRDAT